MGPYFTCDALTVWASPSSPALLVHVRMCSSVNAKGLEGVMINKLVDKVTEVAAE